MNVSSREPEVPFQEGARTRFLLVRHGETDWNREGRIQGRTDVPLNDTGRGQALAVGEALAAERPAILLSSPLGRTMATAEIVATSVGAERIEQDVAFVEQRFGVAEGLSWAQIGERYPDGIPGLEPRPHVVARALAAFGRWAPSANGSPIVVITHGGVINALAAHTSARPEDYPGSAKNGSVTEFVYGGERLERVVPAGVISA